MALTTLADIKTFLGIAQDDTSKDALLTMFKDSVETSVIAFCETDFTEQTVSAEIQDATNSDVIVPKLYPITAVEEVWFGVEVDGSGGFKLDASRDYYSDEGAITLRYLHTPIGRGLIKLKYKWGYTSVPADVKMAVYQTIKAEMQRYDRNTEDVASRSKGDESESYGSGNGGVWDLKSGLPKAIAAKLQQYRIYEFANVNTAQRNR